MIKNIHLPTVYLVSIVTLLLVSFTKSHTSNIGLLEKAQKREEAHALIDHQWVDVINAIKENPAEAREQTPAGWTLLHECAKQSIPNSHSKAGKELLLAMTGKMESKSPLSKEDITAQRPSIKEATDYLDQIAATSVIPLLLKSGISIESKTQDQTTPLHIAARFDRSGEAIKTLIAQHALLLTTDNLQKTALHHAVQNDTIVTTKVLLEEAKKQNLLHALLSAKDKFGRTAYHYAAQNKTSDIAKLLSHAGASIQLQDNDGNTPLHFAADKGHPAMVTFLLKNGASTKAQNKKGQTAAHLAANKAPAITPSKIYMHEQWTTIEAPTSDYLLCLRRLYQKDQSSIASPDFSGKTPLDYAILKNNKEVVHFLQTPHK